MQQNPYQNNYSYDPYAQKPASNSDATVPAASYGGPYNQTGGNTPANPYANNQYYGNNQTANPYANNQVANPYANQVPPLPAYGPAGNQPPRRSGGRRIGLIVLAVLVVLSGLIAAIVIPMRNSQIANTNATATAQSQATVQANATAQSHQATVVAQTNATATAAANVYPFSSVVKLNDPMSDNSKGNGWTTDSNCTFANGAYHVKEENSNNYYTCPATGTNFSNFTYQVTMQFVKGDIGGITFRGNDSAAKYYSFIFGYDGSYVLLNYTGEGKPATLARGNADQFRTGANQENTLAVVARGEKIALYLNGQQLTAFNDATHSSGQIGVIIYDTGRPTEVAFSDAKVWAL